MLVASDNIQITRKKISDALIAKDPAPIQKIVLKCQRNGADIIDINTGPLGKNAEEDMAFFINAVQDVTHLPLMIDTANPDAMAAGLSCCSNKTIINGFSLEPDKMNRILPLAKKYDSDIVGYLLTEKSRVPGDRNERLEIAISLFNAVTHQGLNPSNLIIDPVLVPLIWDNGTFQAMEVIEVVRTLHDLLGFPVRTIIGLSNLTSGHGPLNEKRTMEKTYAGMIAGAGIDIILMNTNHIETMAIAKNGSTLHKKSVFAWGSAS